ncbi:SRPBCC family protein [Sphingobacterium sp. HJSM2_6]|uniref:SRPBCC family protein n=1 Tax=Sphingobacterium sp. HJSM2_6 TaxID=3366264 RepID=UPI003BE6F02D
MEKIILETMINAPMERVFDLSRSIDLHKISSKGTNEQAVGGRTSGLIELDEFVTWHAKHLGFYQKLTVKITSMEKPNFFEDQMLKGAFSKMKHLHLFETIDQRTKMTDIFEFQSPFGFIGTLTNKLFLRNYMMRFLALRNQEIKRVAEGEEWKELLNF